MNFSFFVEPEELQACLDELGRSIGARLWQFPEAGAHGEVIPVRSLSEAPKRILWFGGMPVGRLTWSTNEAAHEAGFTAVVVPTFDAERRVLMLGELFAPTETAPGVVSLLVPLRRRIRKLFVRKLVAVHDLTGTRSRRPGPGASAAALRLLESGVRLAMFEAPSIHYEKEPSE